MTEFKNFLISERDQVKLLENSDKSEKMVQFSQLNYLQRFSRIPMERD